MGKIEIGAFVVAFVWGIHAWGGSPATAEDPMAESAKAPEQLPPARLPTGRARGPGGALGFFGEPAGEAAVAGARLRARIARTGDDWTVTVEATPDAGIREARARIVIRSVTGSIMSRMGLLLRDVATRDCAFSFEDGHPVSVAITIPGGEAGGPGDLADLDIASALAPLHVYLVPPDTTSGDATETYLAAGPDAAGPAESVARDDSESPR